MWRVYLGTNIQTVRMNMGDMIGSTDMIERTDMLVKAVGTAMDEVGEIGQVGVIWFSMGVAIWQIVLMARHLLFAGKIF